MYSKELLNNRLSNDIFELSLEEIDMVDGGNITRAQAVAALAAGVGGAIQGASWGSVIGGPLGGAAGGVIGAGLAMIISVAASDDGK